MIAPQEKFQHILGDNRDDSSGMRAASPVLLTTGFLPRRVAKL
jgi:hypothetical protein